MIIYCKFAEKKLRNITEDTLFSFHCSKNLQKLPTLPQFGQAMCVVATGTIPTIMTINIDLIFEKLVLVANMHETCLNIAKVTFQIN